MTPTPDQGVAYGLVQGLTEFLPISSSGHLVLLPWAFGWSDPGLAFDVALHLGTLLAVLWYYAGDWWRLGMAAVRELPRGLAVADPEALLFWKVAAGSVPAVIAALALEGLADSSFRDPRLIALTLAGFGLLLGWSDRAPESGHGDAAIGWKEALTIGVAQAFAIVPGVSRSGVTITAARFLEIDRATAARFSFLLSTPIIAGAAALKADEILTVVGDPVALIAIAAAALSGSAAIAGLIRFVRTRSYAPFVIYRLIVAALIVFVAAA